MMKRSAIVSAIILAAVACSDSKPASEDSAAQSVQDTAVTAPSDSLPSDSVSMAPAPQVTPPVIKPDPASPPSDIGEARRDPPRSNRDPMPPLTGETSKTGGTMPVYRDSTAGPRMEIDSKGNIRPIKK